MFHFQIHMYEFLMSHVKEIKYFPLYPLLGGIRFWPLPNSYKSCSAGREAGTRGCCTRISQLISLRQTFTWAVTDGERREGEGSRKEGREGAMKDYKQTPLSLTRNGRHSKVEAEKLKFSWGYLLLKNWWPPQSPESLAYESPPPVFGYIFLQIRWLKSGGGGKKMRVLKK